MPKTELHVHSTFSDGHLTPEEIIKEAAKQECQLVAFTDHDEVGAYKQALAPAQQAGIRLIPGIELNTDGADGELHILGFFFDPDHPDMTAHIAWRKDERRSWAQKIIDQLKAFNYEITLDDAMQHAPGDILVRTHIAEALVEKNYFSTAHDAYHRMLVKGTPGFVPRAPFSARDAIKLIHISGGEAYLAHPGAYRFPVDAERLLTYGLDGVEVYHSKHTEETERYWRAFVTEHDLFASGGSDHHGPDSRNPYPIGSVQLDDQSKRHWLNRVDASL
ncbi:PHP domain-containing protein [Lentibacillus sp. CBA3610]|uniref:PHP domain-containing protein n=1 Tax=Lentibacillus sp. CBA3610 TaxID=2518176 RepID=UPI001596047D|nr:PHP domain-containing protein [Lentibacillus sp. CBA3610]QKY69337.1 PHP domain-containing protein [Lentibacillus sp. CBA3610]